jgi:CRISPR-associated endonuclease Cas1
MQAHASEPERSYPELHGDVAVVDGYGIHLRVDRGHLVIHDGIGEDRRERRYSRATCPVKRILVLGHAGSITLDALRWCRDLGIGVAQLDPESGLVFTTARSESSATRIRRGQALAPFTSVGIEVAREILGRKVSGQAAVARRLPGGEAAADDIAVIVDRVEAAETVAEAVNAEVLAAFRYWEAWGPVRLRFAGPRFELLPAQWQTFGARNSPLTSSNRLAVNPANALLNYLYALLEIETTIALHAAGLDPDLGVWHVDKPGRASLSLDVMEAARPVVDGYLLDLLTLTRFRTRDFTETRRGSCRILPPLTHALADSLPALRAAIAPVVTTVAPLFDRHFTSIGARLTVSDAGPTRDSRTMSETPTFAMLPHCPRCRLPYPPGTRPTSGNCEACREGRPAAPNRSAPVSVATPRPTRGAQSQAVKLWNRGGASRGTPARFRDEVLPQLADCSIDDLTIATGLTRAYVRRIIAGKVTPHRRHWEALRTTSSRR